MKPTHESRSPAHLLDRDAGPLRNDVRDVGICDKGSAALGTGLGLSVGGLLGRARDGADLSLQLHLPVPQLPGLLKVLRSVPPQV